MKMPGRKGRAWGNALGGYRKQPRIGGRFASKGTPGAKISNKSRNRAIRRKIYKGAAIALGTGAVVGAGIYAHKSGLDKKIVKAPSTKITMRYAKAGAGALGRGVLSTRITQIGPNRYTVQKGIDTGKEIASAIRKENKFVKRARVVGEARAQARKRWEKSNELHRLLAEAEKRSSGKEVNPLFGPLGDGQRFSQRVMARTPTKGELVKRWNDYLNSPEGARAWAKWENEKAGIKVRSSRRR